MGPIIASLICSDIISGIVAIGFSLRAVGRWVGRWVGIKVGSFFVVVGQVISPHHSDQMSKRSQVSKIAP